MEGDMRTDGPENATEVAGQDERFAVCGYAPVMVKWVDSYGCGSDWEQTRDINAEPHYCYSIGWVLEETSDVIVIAPHLSPAREEVGAEESACGDMTIPMRSVINVTEIGV